MQLVADPCDPAYAQISAAYTQIERWNQSDTNPCNHPWSRIEYHWLLQAPPCECQESWSEQINSSKAHDQEREVPDEVMSLCKETQWKMAEKMVSLCKLAQTSSTQGMWPKTEHPWTRVEKCQARVLSAQSLFEGLTHPPFLVSRSPSLLRDALVPVPGPVLVVSLLS